MDRLEQARSLRKNQTDAESLLWRHLRNRRFMGFKFRRQYIVDHFIVDFICPDLKLILEVDGGQHAENVRYDQRRTDFLESQGYRVIRFWNNEVLVQTEAVLEKIRLVCQAAPHPGPLPGGERE